MTTPARAHKGNPVQLARSILLRHPALIAVLLSCTLLMKLLVPADYMPAVAGGAITLELCSGTVPVPPIAANMAGMHHAGERHGEHHKAEQPCAFAGLGSPALTSADPILRVAALAFAFLLVFPGGALALPAPPARLRPPLRAPPLFA